MSKGSYRGGSTLTGWNANGYAPVSRRLKGRGRTAQSKAESALRDEIVRKRHGLMPRKPNLKARDEAKVEAKQNLRKKSRTTAPVVVKIKRKRAKPPAGAPAARKPTGGPGPRSPR